MVSGWSKCSYANLMSFVIFQLLISSLVMGVVPVMLEKTAQLCVVCESECLDLKWFEILWWAAVFTSLMPCMDACVWVRANFRRCAHLSVMKCNWGALFSSALHGTTDLIYSSTIPVASKMWFLGLPFKEQYVTPAVDEPFASAGRLLLVDALSFAAWFCPSVCKRVLCCFAFTTRLFRTGHCTCVAKFQCDGLLTLAPGDCVGRGKAVVVLGTCTFCSSSNALHHVSRKLMNSVVNGMSWCVVCSSHSLCQHPAWTTSDNLKLNLA